MVAQLSSPSRVGRNLEANPDFARIHPALTQAERLHLDIYGYVVVRNTLTPDEVSTLCATLREIEAIYRATGALPYGLAPNWSTSLADPNFFRIDTIAGAAGCFFDYVTHPRLVAMAEEAVGVTVRLEQCDAHIVRPAHRGSYGFHRGLYTGFGQTEHHLYHFPFVKTLTNLTDLGPDDGGTVVIAGSHKISGSYDQTILACAAEDPSLIHKVVAPAGSTLVFYESLLHSGGIIASDRERLLIIGGYTPAMFQPYTGCEPDPAFVAGLPAPYREFFSGSRSWDIKHLHRDLNTPRA